MLCGQCTMFCEFFSCSLALICSYSPFNGFFFCNFCIDFAFLFSRIETASTGKIRKRCFELQCVQDCSIADIFDKYIFYYLFNRGNTGVKKMILINFNFWLNFGFSFFAFGHFCRKFYYFLSCFCGHVLHSIELFICCYRSYLDPFLCVLNNLCITLLGVRVFLLSFFLALLF